MTAHPAPPFPAHPGSDIGDWEFAALQRFLAESSGIVIPDHKRYLVAGRLSHLPRELGLPSFAALARQLADGSATTEIKARVIDAMTINETSWFRDRPHFDALRRHVLPALFARPGNRPIRIWSAACATGPEPYSLSIAVDEAIAELRVNGRIAPDVTILGTDIAKTALAEAQAGEFSEFSLLRGIDDRRRRQFFEPVADRWRVAPEIRGRVTFRLFNLLSAFEVLGTFDVIFIRNVLIYFGEATRIDILERLAARLSPEGVLFLASTETLPAGFHALHAVPDQVSRYYRRSR